MRFILIAALWLTAALSHAQGYPFACVDNVPTDQWLNVRSGPGVGFDKVGELGRTETGVAVYNSVQVGSSSWIYIAKGEVHGWVNRRFLTSETYPGWRGHAAVPGGLVCSGFEPGWVLELIPGGDIQILLPSATGFLAPLYQGQADMISNPYGPLMLRAALSGSRQVTGTVAQGACYSGADAPYPFSAVIAYTDDRDQQQSYHGCCHMPGN